MAPVQLEYQCETCSLDHEGDSLIRLSVATPLEGCSTATDRIINHWRPRLHSLVCSANSMYLDIRTPQARGQESYPCCGFLNLVGPENSSKRLFIDEACGVLLSVLTSEEIMTEVYWPGDRKFDARDVMEWFQRWGAWLPDEEGQLRFWSIFMDCDQMETFYRYVHAMVRQYYLELLERHCELGEDYKRQEETEDFNQGDLESLPNFYPVPEEIIYYHPRLFLDGRAFWLTEENAEELRDWAYDAFGYWHKGIDKDQKEALVMVAMEADKLCPEKRWPD